jgi:uncharacterized protein YegL
MKRIEKIEDLGDFDIGVDDLVDTTTKLPVLCALDVSDSMSWYGGIDNLNSAIRVFIDAIRSDDYAKASVEVAFLTFNHNIKEFIPFTPIGELDNIENFEATGGTDLDIAIDRAINELRERKQYYKQNNIKYNAPWLVLVTDCDIPNPSSIDKAVKTTTSLIDKQKITMFSIGAGKEVNLEQLKRFNPKNPVLHTPEVEDLVPLFKFISQTAIGYSQVGDGNSFKSEPLNNRRIEFV